MAMTATPRFPPALDNTIVERWRKCRRLCWYEHVLGCSSPVRNEHLHFGGCYAAGVETARRAFYSEGKSLDASIVAGSQRILAEWGDYTPPDNTVKTRANCIDAFDRYAKEVYPFGIDDLIPYRVAPDAPPMIEFSFALELPFHHPDTGEPLHYAGRADMVGTYRSQCDNRPWEGKTLWAVDEKSTKDMGPLWANQWRLSGQFIGYVKALRELENITVEGVCVRGVCLYKTQAPKFQESFVPIPEWRVNDWWNNLLGTVEEMIMFYRYCTGQDVLPGRDWGHACSSYGGCSFLDVCEIEHPIPFLETEYFERRWNPLTRTEERSDELPMDYSGAAVPFKGV